MGEPLGLYAHHPSRRSAARRAAAAWRRRTRPPSTCARWSSSARRSARSSPLADAIFAVQGLGLVPDRAGRQRREAPRDPARRACAARIGAFALTEPEAGSDVASLQDRRPAATATTGSSTATRSLISNGRSRTTSWSSPARARHSATAARHGERGGGRAAITAFLVDSGAKGGAAGAAPDVGPAPDRPAPLRGLLRAGQRAPRRGGRRLQARDADARRLPDLGRRGGERDGGARSARRSRTSRGARQFGAPLSEQQMVRAYLAEMATELDAAAAARRRARPTSAT